MMRLNSFILKKDVCFKNNTCNDEFWHFRKMKKLSYKKKYCEVAHICKWIHSYRWILPLTSIQNFNEIIQIGGTTKHALMEWIYF